jgi:hypothetical protein
LLAEDQRYCKFRVVRELCNGFDWLYITVVLLCLIDDLSARRYVASMGSNDKTFDFPKLNGSNYYDWSWHMTLLLKSKSWFGHADGSITCPARLADDANAAEITAWKLADDRAHAAICLAVESEHATCLRPTTTAAAAWKALQDKFHRTTLFEKVRILREFHGHQLQPGSDVRLHINRMEELHEQLRQLGCVITDDLFAMTLLGTLPIDEYGPILASFDVAGDAALTSERVKNLLLQHADRVADSAKADSGSEAMVARSSRFGDVRCFNCDEHGHISKDCPRRNRDRRTQYRGPERGGRKGGARDDRAMRAATGASGTFATRTATCRIDS